MAAFFLATSERGLAIMGNDIALMNALWGGHKTEFTCRSALIWAAPAVKMPSHWTVRCELAAFEDLCEPFNDESVERLTPFAGEHRSTGVIESHLFAPPPLLRRLVVHAVMPQCVLMLLPQVGLAITASVDICLKSVVSALILKLGNAKVLGVLVQAQAKDTWLLRAECGK